MADNTAGELEHNELTLKWGTLKAWRCITDKSQALLEEYREIGTSASAMMGKDTPRQKEIICELIDECDDPEGIFLDWDGEYVSKQKAKEYVLNYGKRSPAVKPDKGQNSPLADETK